MGDKLRLANRQIKYLDVDFERQTNNKREIIEKLLGYMKEEANLSDRKRLDILMRRTKIIILGKEAVPRRCGDRDIYTVPVLLECRTEADKLELEEIMRGAGWYGTYHWPKESMEFVQEARQEVKRMGYTEQSHYIKIRPEERDGRLQIKGEVKEKQGGRFKLVAVWGVPPVDKTMWSMDMLRPRLGVGRNANS